MQSFILNQSRGRTGAIRTHFPALLIIKIVAE